MIIDLLFIGWLLASTLGVLVLWIGFETAAEWSDRDED